MTTNEKRYWGYRIDTDNIEFLNDELNQNRLRQGWGWDEGQNLQCYPLKVDGGASKNRRMLQVKKGDILLVPRLPMWSEVAVVEATEDWKTGYSFNIPEGQSDYGHCFPARRVAKFVRSSKHVSGDVRSSLKARNRFWNMDYLKDDIEMILGMSETELLEASEKSDVLESEIERIFTDGEFEFGKKIYEKMNEKFSAKDWEIVLREVFKKLFPIYEVTIEQGIMEANHGTDILVKIPGLDSEYKHAIAVQVKDYTGAVDSQVIEQVNKADWWEKQYGKYGLKIIQKVVVFTKAQKEDNEHLLEKPDDDITFIFADGLQEILTSYAKKHIGSGGVGSDC